MHPLQPSLVRELEVPVAEKENTKADIQHMFFSYASATLFLRAPGLIRLFLCVRSHEPQLRYKM